MFSVFVASIIAGNGKNRHPIAIASSDIKTGKAPLEVNFYGYGSDKDGSIVSYHWNFGDRETSNLQNPTHTYQKKGRYTVTFTVTDNDGSSREHTLNIYVKENIPPVATASASRTSGDEPLRVEFTGKGTDRDGKIESYYWDFGDGETTEEKNPTHTYKSSGNYKVVFTVTDDSGDTDTDEIEIHVSHDYDPYYPYYYYPPYYYPWSWNYPYNPYDPYYNPYDPYYNPYDPYSPWSYITERPIIGKIVSLFKK